LSAIFVGLSYQCFYSFLPFRTSVGPQWQARFKFVNTYLFIYLLAYGIGQYAIQTA